jgi:RNA polymerase sigma factor (sigma-70 family)
MCLHPMDLVANADHTSGSPEQQDKSGRFLSVIESHKGILYTVANAYCKNTEDRKDLIQEIVIQIWHAFDTYDPQFKYSTWIYRIALNVAISFYRKETRRMRISGHLPDDILTLPDATYDAQKSEEIEILHRFIAELCEFDKALMLLYLDEKSYKEIAEITGITETNVATKIARIKIALKAKFTSLNQ